MSIRHVVKTGENLTLIAQHYNLKSWKDIYFHEDNRTFRAKRHNPNLIYPGDILFIPGDVPPIRPPSPPPGPAPVPPPVRPEPTDERLIFKSTFEERLINRPARDPWGGGWGAALGEGLLQASKDIPRMLKYPIERHDFDDGMVRLKQTRRLPATYVMKLVTIEVDVRRLPNKVFFGGYAICLNIGRTYQYIYGAGQPTDMLPVIRTETFTRVFPDQERLVLKDIDQVPQPSNYLDPR